MRLPAHLKNKKTATKMKALRSGEANLMRAFYQMQVSTTSNPDFMGYQ
jgi:hypothetical protein